jgi:hypothetical protein
MFNERYLHDMREEETPILAIQNLTFK